MHRNEIISTRALHLSYIRRPIYSRSYQMFRPTLNGQKKSIMKVRRNLENEIQILKLSLFELDQILKTS